MHHIFIIKAAHNICYGIDLTDMAEELVTQPLSSAGSLNQAGNIDKFHGSRENLPGLYNRSQGVKPGIRHGHNSHIRFNGAERIIGRFRSCRGNGIKDSGLTHVWKADDTAFKSHVLISKQR
jgi:hypothetical protein